MNPNRITKAVSMFPHSLPPTPKTPLKQAYRKKDQLGARNVQIITPGSIFNFLQFATFNFNHFQEFQHSERHLIEGHRQKPASQILAQNATSRNCRATEDRRPKASRTPSTSSNSVTLFDLACVEDWQLGRISNLFSSCRMMSCRSEEQIKCQMC